MSTGNPCPQGGSPIGGGGTSGSGGSGSGGSGGGVEGTGGSSSCFIMVGSMTKVKTSENCWWEITSLYLDCGGNGNKSIHDVDPCTSGNNGVAIFTPDFVPSTPCEKLKSLFEISKANITPLVNILKTTIIPTNSGEKGVILNKDNNNYSSAPTATTPTNSVSMPIYTSTYGNIHTHPLDTYPMFSWSDVHMLSQFYQHSGDDAVCILVVKDDYGVDQLYSIVINNNGSNVTTVSDALNQPELDGCSDLEKKKFYDNELGERFQNDDNYERAFLRQFFGFNISLYKANSNLTNWNKLTLDPVTSIINNNPCNN